MESIIPNLYVGGNTDYERLKDKPGWSFLRCCKEGPGGHRETVGYTTLGAPKGKDYLTATKGNRMALNFIDANDPNLIPQSMVRDGIKYIDQKLADGDKVLVACNAGHSRGPAMALLYLRAIGDLSGNFITSERRLRTLYPQYDPSLGMRTFSKQHWTSLENLLRKDQHGR